MNKSKKKGTNKWGGHIPPVGAGEGSGGDRDRQKNGCTTTQVHPQQAGPNTTKHTSTAGDNNLSQCRRMSFSSCQQQEQQQRPGAQVLLRSCRSTGNAWGLTTRLGGRSGDCGSSLVVPAEKGQEGAKSIAAALGLVKGDDDTKTAGSSNESSTDVFKAGSIKSTSASSNRSSSNSGSDSRGKSSSRNTNSDASETNNTTAGKGLGSCWKRADGRKNSRAYALAAGRALGMTLGEKPATGTPGGEVVLAVGPTREVGASNGGAALQQSRQAAGSSVLLLEGDKREQQGVERVEQGAAGGAQLTTKEDGTTRRRACTDDANGEIVVDQAILSDVFQWQQQSAAFDSMCWPSNQLPTEKPSYLLRSQTVADGVSGENASGGGVQRQLQHSNSLGSASIRPTAGGARPLGKGRVRHSSSLKTASSEDADENQPLSTSAMALQSALVCLLQAQDQQKGVNGRAIKPVMPRRNLMCTSLLRTGACANPERCNYAHNLLELQKKLELRKTSLCKYWLKGKCENDDCNFAHGEHELQSTDGVYKTTICKYWKQGACYSGSSCRHAHGEDDLRPERLPPHLERKRLQQLQKAPWRSSSFSPTTGNCGGGVPVIFDRTRSAVDIRKGTGRSEAGINTAPRSLMGKGVAGGELSNVISSLNYHLQDREEAGSADVASIAAHLLADVAAGTCFPENVLLEVLKKQSLGTSERKLRPDDTGATTDPAALLTNAASVLSRIHTLPKDDNNDDSSTFMGSSTPMMPPTNSDAHRENATLLRSMALLERVASASGLQADRLLQLRDSGIPGGGSPTFRGPPPGLDGVDQRLNGSERLRGGSAAAEAAAAAAGLGAADTQRGTPVSPSPETTKQAPIQTKVKTLLSTICSSLLELQQLVPNECGATADSSLSVVAGTTTSSSGESDFLPNLLNGLNVRTRQPWSNTAEVSPSKLSSRPTSLPKASRFAGAAEQMPTGLSGKSDATATLQLGSGCFAVEAANGVAGSVSASRNISLQDVLGCSEIFGRAGLVAGNGELDSVRLQQLLTEEVASSTSGPLVASPDKIPPFQPSNAASNRAGRDHGHHHHHEANSFGVLRMECGNADLEKQSIFAPSSAAGVLDGYSCSLPFNKNSVCGAKSTSSPEEASRVSTAGNDGESVRPNTTVWRSSSADYARTASGGLPRDAARDAGGGRAVNDGVGRSEGSAVGIPGAEMGNTLFFAGDNRFSSACWRATDAEATLLNTHRSSSAFHLDGPLNRSATCPSMGAHKGEASAGGGCRLRTDEYTESTTHRGHSHPQQLQGGGPTACRPAAGETENTKESGGQTALPSTPGFTFTELFERGAQECFDFEDEASGAAGQTGDSRAMDGLQSGNASMRKRKEEQHEMIVKSVWGQTTFFDQNNPVNPTRLPVADSPGAVNTLFEKDVFVELSESVAALRMMTAEKDTRLGAGKGRMVMQPLKENVEESEEDAGHYTGGEDCCACQGRCTCCKEGSGGACESSRQMFGSISSGTYSGSNVGSCGVVPLHDDAAFSVSTRCLSTVGGVRSPSGGALTNSVDCGSPSALSDSSASGKTGKKLLDLSSSSSTIFPHE